MVDYCYLRRCGRRVISSLANRTTSKVHRQLLGFYCISYLFTYVSERMFLFWRCPRLSCSQDGGGACGRRGASFYACYLGVPAFTSVWFRHKTLGFGKSMADGWSQNSDPHRRVLCKARMPQWIWLNLNWLLPPSWRSRRRCSHDSILREEPSHSKLASSGRRHLHSVCFGHKF